MLNNVALTFPISLWSRTLFASRSNWWNNFSLSYKKERKLSIIKDKIKNKDCKIIIEPVNIYISEAMYIRKGWHS